MENTRNNASGRQIAVIILNWNGRKLLEEYLPAVVANTDPSLSKIIVADNGSTDDSTDYITHEFPDIEIIAFDRNYGFAEGYNRAIAAADYPYVVLLNSDVAPAKGWDTALHTFISTHPEYGACQPKVLSRRKPTQFEYAGAAGGFIDRNGYPFCRGRIFSTCETDSGQYDTTADIFWATGACLMVRRQTYIDAGGLDSSFFAHMEEIDLCWRIQLAGEKIAAVPEAVVYHLGGGSLPAENPKKTYLNFRNNLLMLHKNLPDSIRSRFLFRRRLLDTLAWVKYVVTFDLQNAAAIVRAHRDFRRMARQYTTHPDTNLLPPTLPNILTDYYLRGKKHYNQLEIKTKNEHN